jgi:hypothetical protein
MNQMNFGKSVMDVVFNGRTFCLGTVEQSNSEGLFLYGLYILDDTFTDTLWFL